jgi:tetratricopeptide (TPR) repeat protein
MSRKFLAFSFVLAVLPGLFFAQTRTQPAKPETQKDTVPVEIKVYQRAVLFSDYDVAKNALYSLITKYPDRLDYLDSLARLYFSINAFPQAILASQIVLEKQPDNMALIELTAVSYNSMGQPKEALENYEKVYAVSKNIQHAYQLAVLQYTMKRYGECETMIKTILENPKSKEETLSLNDQSGSQQQVPLAAATYNLKGVMNKDLNKADQAKADFEESLKIYPDFTLAKNNLEAMKAPPADSSNDKEKKKK